MADRLRSLIRENRNVHNPDAHMQAGRGTLTTNEDGSVSSRAPSPEEINALGDAHDRAGGRITLESVEAEARAYGLDPAQYGADKERLHSDVAKERPRMARMAGKFDTAPASYRFDPVNQEYLPDTYKFVPTAETKQYNQAYRDRVALKQAERAIRARYGHAIGPESSARLKTAVEYGDKAGVAAIKRQLDVDNMNDRAKNRYDMGQNAHFTREIQSTDRAPGFVYRTLRESSPAERSALYRVLGWGDAAAAETQAQMVRDSLDSQMAIASQNKPDNPDDKTLAGQAKRNWMQIDSMLATDPENGPANAVNAATYINVQVEGMDAENARKAAEASIADRMARVPHYRTHPLVSTRMANKAKEGRDAFVAWAASVNIPAAEASVMWERLMGRSPPPAAPREPTTASAGGPAFPPHGDL